MSIAMNEHQEEPMIPRDTFAARLLLLRHELDLTVDQISAQCDIASATWSTWENGVKPRDMDEVVRKIAAGTGYDREWLMWGGLTLRGKSEDEPTLSVLHNPAPRLPGVEWPRPPQREGRHLTSV